MPVWDKLGATATEGIVIAKIDATTNDMPVGIDLQVQGFPTIVLFKAGDNAIVKHDGDRTLEGFKAFLKENAVNGAKIVIDDDEEVSAEEVEEKDEL
jgi:protein disulfide-isomerase A1